MHSMHGMPQDERHRHGNAWNYAPPPSYYDERRTPTLLPPARDRALPPGAPAGIPLPPLRATLYREEREEIRDPREWRAPLHHRDPTYASSAEYVPSRSSAQPRLELFSHSAPPSSATVSRKRFLQDHHHHHEEEDDGDMEEHPDRFGPAQGYYHHSNSTGPTGAHAEGPFTIATRELTAVNSASSSSSKKRSRRMSNSERGKLYRSRRKEYVETLEEQLEEMKRELEELRLHQTKSSTTTANSTASHPDNAYALMDATAVVRDRSRAGFARTVCEYFSLFQFGVVHPVGGANSTSSPQNQNGMSPGAVSSTNPQASRQIAVLQTLVDPNMRFGQQFGIQMLMEQWERYSTYHSALKFDLNSLEISMDDPLPMIVATASLKVRFSRTTIEKVFPHVLWNEELVQRLIGLDIEYPVSNKFYFGADGKIKRYETEVDFVSAFVQALGSTRDAMQLVGNALIKEQSRIGPEGVEDSASSSGIDPTGRSPTGSTVSSQSSTPSSASAVPTTEVPAARYRYKQSEPRTTEQVEEEEYDHPAQQHASTEYYDRNRRDYRQPAYNPDHFRGDTTDHRRHHNFDRDSPFTKAPERPSHPQRDGHSPPPEQFV